MLTLFSITFQENRRRMSGTMALICLLFGVLLCSTSYAACDKRPLTTEEQSFYSTLVTLFETSLPAPEGWRRHTQWPRVPTTRCDGRATKPIQYGGQFKFTEITESDRIREEMAIKQKALEQKVLAASQRGDIAEMSRLQGEMQQLLVDNMAAMQELQQIAQNTPKPKQIIARFKINETRRVVGKKFEISTLPHTAKTFETVSAKGSDDEKVARKLYIGPWRIEDFKKNWNLFRPEAPYDSIASFRLEISGKRADVEDYLLNVIDLASLESATR